MIHSWLEEPVDSFWLTPFSGRLSVAGLADGLVGNTDDTFGMLMRSEKEDEENVKIWKKELSTLILKTEML